MTKAKTIAFALPDGLTLGGVTVWSVEMARRLVARGQMVTILEHQAYYNPKIDLDLPPQAEHLSCLNKVSPNSPFLTTPHVTDYLPTYRTLLPGIIIPNWAYGTFAACAALATEQPDKLRVIGYAHSDEIGYYDWLSYYEAIIHRFIASTPDIAAKLSRRLPHRQTNILIQPNPVDAPSVLQRSYAQAGSPLRLVYIARIEQRQKRVYDLVHLVKSLAAENVNFQLRVIGDGADKESLSRKFKTLDPAIQQRISLERSVSLHQLREVWLSQDIFILVSEYEGTSLAMLQSMAHGCIPVVTQVSGTSLIEQGINGFCVPVGEMAQMAHTIKCLDNDRQQLPVLGQQAHAAIGAQFGFDTYLNRFLNIVDQIWQEPPRPWPTDQPLLPPLNKITPADVTTALRGDRAALRILLVKLIARPGLRWLYQYRHLAKKVLE